MSYSEALMDLNSLQESFSFKNHSSKISSHHMSKNTLGLQSTGRVPSQPLYRLRGVLSQRTQFLFFFHLL